MQIVAIEIVIHLHNDDSVAAAAELNTAFGCVHVITTTFTK